MAAATRERIVEVAARLLQEKGPAAVTTRAVAEAAGVQAPTIYRLFGDKDGLLEAVAEQVMATYVAAKARAVAQAADADVDPVQDLRASWTLQIEFGLANPAIFRLLSDPDRVRHSAAARQGRQLLESRIRRVAATGRLRVSEGRAVDLIQAAGNGVIQVLLTSPERDLDLAAAMLDTVLAQILRDGPAAADDPTVAAAVALKAVAPQLDRLTTAERLLLADWLDRLLR